MEGTAAIAIEESRVFIRRQWNDYRVGSVSLDDITGLRWDRLSGGVGAPSPQPLIHGYVSCDRVDGEIAHSCLHGSGPHTIKVCVVKKDNTSKVYATLLALAGPRPGKKAKGAAAGAR